MDDERVRLEHVIFDRGERGRILLDQASSSLRSASYSPSARLTLERISDLSRLHANVFLITPPGVDIRAWMAFAHTEGPRENGPFVFVDASEGVFHELTRWQDDKLSPLALADGGTLAIEHGTALPWPIQEHLARLLARSSDAGSRKSEVLGPALLMSSTSSMSALLEDGRLSPKLARWFEGQTVDIPSLAERAEDLRPLVLAHLARMGVSRSGQPLGIELGALRVLIEHAWPGNDGELVDILLRATSSTEGPKVTIEALRHIGFGDAQNHEAPERAPPPVILPAGRPPSRRRVARRH